MGYIAQLIKGSKKIDLASGRYKLALDFNPPLVSENVWTAAGTSANAYGGQSFVGRAGINQEFEFGVHVSGGSAMEIQRAINDINMFLRQAGDEADPVYLKFRSSADVSYEPKWGQGSRYYEVISGGASYGDMFGWGTLQARSVPNCRVRLTVKPYALGQKQRLGFAIGSVMEDYVGRTDGTSRGLIVPSGRKNYVTNPIFANATYDTGWTAQADLTAAQNTDGQFVLFGNNSVRLSRTGASADNLFYSVVSATATTTHTGSFYVKRPDGGAVATAHCEVKYAGSVQTTTYESVGDGWYRVQASFSAVAGSATFGVTVNSPYTVYVDGFQFEESAFPTALFYGDLPGCAWGGTEHASFTAVVTARCYVPAVDCISPAQGTLVVAWRAPAASTALTACYLLFDSQSGMRIRFASDTWGFTDGVNLSDSATTSFAQGDKIIFHACYGPDGSALYRNGVSIGSNATFTVPATGGNMYIGSSDVDTQYSDGTFMDVTTFDRKMTAGEVALDYANRYQVIADDQPSGRIPWLWTPDGDGTFDKYVDTDHENYGIAGGIAGNVAAKTTWKLTPSTIAPLTINVNPSPVVYKPSSMFLDLGATTDVAVAGAVGGYVESISVSDIGGLTSSITFPATTNLVPFFDKPLYLYTSLYDEGGTSIWGRAILEVNGSSMMSNYMGMACSTVLKDFVVGPIQYPKQFFKLDYASGGFTAYGYFKRSSGTANMEIDYLQALWGKVAYLYLIAGDYVLIEGRRASTASTGDLFYKNVQLTGDILDLEPNQYNHIVILNGHNHGGNSEISYVVTATSIYVTPRWMIA